MNGRLSELTGAQATALQTAATRAGFRPDVDVALDGSLLFSIGERVFDTLIETIKAFDDLAALREVKP